MIQKSELNAEVAPPTDTPFVIEVVLRSMAQLFESPGPLLAGPRALHPQILDAIVEQAARAPRGSPLQLVLRLPAASLAEPHEIGAALREYFVFRAEADRRGVRRILLEGRWALVIGMVFLTIATAVAEVIHRIEGRFLSNVANGLEIFGWVALWRPAELLLYEWMPVYRRQRLMERLAQATIECRPA
jgi:hypothetical protein